jgi:NAD(P)-dependent dehydrogenase (short-subunit alcohol dehydrogenase family)
MFHFRYFFNLKTGLSSFSETITQEAIMKKVILFGAQGTVGKKVRAALESAKFEVITVGRKSGEHQVEIENAASVKALYEKIGSFDHVVSAAGEVAFAPLAEITQAQWTSSLQSKLLGQINLVQEALLYIQEKGSFTLVSGVVSECPIAWGAVATTVNRAIEGYAMASACELPKSLRINVVSPNVLEESMNQFGAFFPGVKPVAGDLVAQTFLQSVMGVQSGRVFKVH